MKQENLPDIQFLDEDNWEFSPVQGTALEEFRGSLVYKKT